jgi:hypothetical protein
MTFLEIGCGIRWWCFRLRLNGYLKIQLSQDLSGLRGLDARRVFSDYPPGVLFGSRSVLPFISRTVTDIAKRVLRLANEFVSTSHPGYPVTGLNV